MGITHLEQLYPSPPVHPESEGLTPMLLLHLRPAVLPQVPHMVLNEQSSENSRGIWAKKFSMSLDGLGNRTAVGRRCRSA